MNNIWSVLGLALLPALGNFCGGLLAEHFPVSRTRLNKALHAAAGVVLAVVAVELMPEALGAIPGWGVALGFGLGGLAYVAIERLVDRLQGDDQGEPRLGVWMIFIAVSVDLFSDGLMIGAGSTISFGMALILALGQVMADVPEGYATIANMKDKGIPRGRRLLLSATFALPVLGAAMLAFFLLQGRAEYWQMGALSCTAGLLTVAAVEDMLSEAHESQEDTRYSVLAFVGGFVLFTLVSAGLGGLVGD